MTIKLPRYFSGLSIPDGLTEENYLKNIYEKLFGISIPTPTADSWYYEIDAPGWTRGHPDEYDARLGYVDPDGRFRFHIIDQGPYSRINFTMCYSVIMHHEDIGSSADWHLREDADSLEPRTQFCIYDRAKGERIFVDGNAYVRLSNDREALKAQKERCETNLDREHPGWRVDPLIGW
jgi:hypothetical protein